MNLLYIVNGFMSRYIVGFIILLSTIAFIIPEYFVGAVTYTPLFLGIAMFGMGLTISMDDFLIILRNPKDILVGVVAQYTIMPFIAWLLCSVFFLPADIAIGVILVGCCPGGTASNVITYIAKGDVALSVGMTTVSTLLAPCITPCLIYLIGGTWIDIELVPMIMTVIKVVLIPIILGIGVQILLDRHINLIRPVSPLLSMIAIVIIIAAIIAVNKNAILTSGLITLIVVCLHNLSGLLIGLGVAKLFRFNYDKTSALAIEVGMQNSGLAVAIATANFAINPLAALAGAIFSVWHNISGSIFASIRSAKYLKSI